MTVFKSRWLRIALVILVALALAAYAAMHLLYPARAKPEQVAAQMKAQAALTGPAKVYAATCAHCHDPAAGGRIGPALGGRGLSPDAVKVIVRAGVGSMPGFLPSNISDAELTALALHVSQMPAAPGSEKKK